MTRTRKVRRKLAGFFYDVGNAVQYYEPTDPTPYSEIHYADVSVYYPVSSSRDYDETTTAVMDAAAKILDNRQWTAGAKLDIYDEESE